MIRFVHTRQQQHAAFFSDSSSLRPNAIKNTFFPLRSCQSNAPDYKIETKLSAKADEEYKVEMKQQREKKECETRMMCLFSFTFFFSSSLIFAVQIPGPSPPPLPSTTTTTERNDR